MPTDKQKHAQAHEDYRKLQSMYGDIYDYCGAWCNNDVLDLLLKYPTYKQATKHLESLIGNYFSNNLESGGDINVIDPDVYEIGKRYGYL